MFIRRILVLIALCARHKWRKQVVAYGCPKKESEDDYSQLEIDFEELDGPDDPNIYAE